MNNSRVSQAVSGVLISELNSDSDTAGYHRQPLSFSLRFCCLHRHYVGQDVYSYKEWWNEMRVKILRKKYTSKLKNQMKLQSFRSIMHTNFRGSRPVFESFVCHLLSVSPEITS